jgi:hypothetical protein
MQTPPRPGMIRALLQRHLIMKPHRYPLLTFVSRLAALTLASTACGATFTLDQLNDVATPSTRGEANTTFFGWETFDDPGAGNPINDTTPNIGTTTTGVAFVTTNGENHRSGSGNIYVGTSGHTLYEQVTVATDGTVGTSGTTTIIAQFVTAFGDFPGAITMSQINGINPTVVRGVNAASEGQIWAKWQIPGNAASYTFTLTGPAGVTAYSIDRLVVDTHWSSTTPQPDAAVSASPPTFKMDQEATVVAPTTRGNANTTYFGWDTFCEVGFDNVPINDSTPDIGTTTTGVSFVTTNGEDHVSSSRNLYVGAGTLSEEVTVVTDGTVGSGFTTIIAQAVTAFGGFPAASLTFSSINGVAPQVVQTTNIAGKGQVWAKWRLPGNQASYTFTVTGPTGVSGWSFDKFIVDTLWSATVYQADSMQAGNSALQATVDQVPDALVPSSRGNANTTWFGWETFTNPGGNAVDPINDETPDIGTPVSGASIVTQNGQDHLSSTNNIYAGTNGMSLHERVTVVTNAPPGTPATGANSGTTTIIAQTVSQAGAIRTPIHFGSINGIEPTVVTATNSAGKGQIWAKWVIPGNPSSSYTFDITSDVITGGPSMSISIDRLIVDTVWRLSGSQPDTVRSTTPPTANVLSAISGAVTPSTRGNVKTTWFGWETFNNVDNRTMGVSVINDSTPDIGHTTTAGANFRTTNAEGHVLSSGNIYFISGTLSEQITVPTNGVAGSGFTTILLQIVSATGAPGGDNAFAGPITLDIGGTAPTYQVEGANSSGAGQLWAKWELPGNEASYTINVAGPPNQAHFSFERVIVDTYWNATGFQEDSMAGTPPSIATASPLPNGGLGEPHSQQIEGTGGSAPYSFTVSAGALPAGLTLSPGGLISGSATVLGAATFTVRLEDHNGLTAEREFTLEVTPTMVITTGATLKAGVLKVPYSQTLVGTGGAQPYLWSVISGTLPDGLALSAEGVLSGIPSTAGDSSFTVQLTENGGFSITKSFSLSVSASFLLPTVDPIVFPVATIGADFGYTVSAGNYPQSFSITGLPRGLRYVAATGVISGRPAATGVYLIQVRARNKAGTSSTVTAPLVVKALPVGMIGTFAGLLARDASVNGGLGGKFDLATTTKGSFSLKITRGTKTKTATGFLAASAPQISILFDGLALQITLDSTTGLVSGSLGGASLSGWRNTWNLLTRPASSREGYYSFSLDLADAGDDAVVSIPQGQGYANFAVAPNGTLKIIGKSADGQTFSCSGFMGPDGQICLYSALYRGLGSLLGQLTLSEDPAGTFIGNTIVGNPTWMKPTTVTRTYAAGFGPIHLVAEGAYLAASSKSLILGLPEEGTVMLRFTDGGLAEAELDPDLDLTWTHDNKVVLPASNSTKVALSINAKTGAVTGNFTLVEPSPALTRAKVPCVGQIVRLNDGSIRAVGHFLLPQIPTTGQSIRTSPILSGGLLLLQ